MQLDKVFFESFFYFVDLNLFGTGSPKYVPSKPYKGRKEIDSSMWLDVSGRVTDLKDPTGINLVNKESLFFLSYGVSRAPKYFDYFELQGDLTDPKRSEEELSLALIQPDKSKNQESTVDCWQGELCRR
jgi:hypothetical protein